MVLILQGVAQQAVLEELNRQSQTVADVQRARSGVLDIASVLRVFCDLEERCMVEKVPNTIPPMYQLTEKGRVHLASR